jgi:hypothetical protein
VSAASTGEGRPADFRLTRLGEDFMIDAQNDRARAWHHESAMMPGHGHLGAGIYRERVNEVVADLERQGFRVEWK